jgi:CheY-like chemotaxis protein
MAKKILVIDDSKLNRNLLKSVLDGAGYLASVACDGNEGLNMLHNEKFDLLVLDLILPGMDGFAVLTLIKSDPQLKSIPIVVLTARDSQEEHDEAISLGARDCFVKYKFTHIELLKYLSLNFG